MRKRALTAAVLFLILSTYPVRAQEKFDASFDKAPSTVDPLKTGNPTKSDRRSGVSDAPRPKPNQGRSGSTWDGFYAGANAGRAGAR